MIHNTKTIYIKYRLIEIKCIFFFIMIRYLIDFKFHVNVLYLNDPAYINIYCK